MRANLLPTIPTSALPPITVTTTTELLPTTSQPPPLARPRLPPATVTTRRPVLPTRTTARPKPAGARPVLTGSLAPYQGLGTWADVYDWSRSYTNNKPGFGVADVDRMASVGVQTLFIQTSFHDFADDVVDRDLLTPIIERAHARGVRVVAWYLPTLEDPNADLRRLYASAQLAVDGLAVDVESRKVDDVGERNRRLVALSGALRQSLPGRAIGAIVLPPVVMEVVNPNYWPGFPWTDLVPYYDVWLPMSYWTNRTTASGYRDGYRYTAEDITRLRADLGLPSAPVHTIGGIGDKSTTADVDGMVRAVADTGAMGGSIYDYRTTGSELYPHLAALRG